MEKILNTAALRALEKQVALGEISYGKMVEIINEKAFIQLCNGIEKANNRWVSVNDELPKQNQRVIFYSKKYDLQAIADFRTGVFMYGGERYRIDEISHWQPLLTHPTNKGDNNGK
jgi:hypothetical protein